MTAGAIRKYCLALPGTAERFQWGSDLLFCIGGKMFAVLNVEPDADVRLSFKCTPQRFADLTERDGIVPAPYVARYHWVALTSPGAMTDAELGRCLRDSYQMVKAKLPPKVRKKI